MNSNYGYLRQMEPILVSRECGGWLARVPKGAPIRIAVTGFTEVEAREKFAKEVAIWTENLDAVD